MNDLITWVVAFALILGALGSLVYDYQYKQSRTVEQYKKDLEEKGITGNAFAKAGLLELEKFLKPDLSSAVEQIEDEKKGRTKTNKQGDADDPTNPETETI